MITHSHFPVVLALGLLASPVFGQGPLDPARRPSPTMKSLQEIWDKIGGLQTQVEGLNAQVSGLEAQNAALQQQNAAIQQQNAVLLQQLNALHGVVTMEMVPVGNPGNPPDPGNTSEPDTYGAVAYEYRIGKYEVTNAQYAAFLNAVAATDTKSLYNTSMGSNARGGITRSGTAGSYTYTVRANMGDKPVNYVSWYDAVRFCNWLHNGQPKGPQDGLTTEGGAYTLTAVAGIGVGTDPTHAANGRNAGAQYWIPSENEWYKAAYHVPTIGDNYWAFPTQSNATPTVATADLFGNINNDTVRIANYDGGADWNGQDGNVTTVGSGGPGSASYYDAFDMGGNVWEWNEQAIGGSRGLRGGSWGGGGALILQSSYRLYDEPTTEGSVLGFRVAGP